MTIDPRDYDLGELRDMAQRGDREASLDGDDPSDLFDTVDSRRRRPNRGAAEVARRDDRHRTLLMLQSATDGEPTKPYLDEIPASHGGEVIVFEWLEFLVNRAGFRGAMEALRYYRNIDWLTEDAMHALEEYLFGFSDAESDRYGELTADDHRESLVYLAELNALQQR